MPDAEAIQSSARDAHDLADPALYYNRELSLLAFQRRVLAQAEDRSNPLLERLKFLSIVGSNLDEFFMIRVAGLLTQVEAGVADTSPDGLSPQRQLTAIRREVKKIFSDANACFEKQLLPELRQAGIYITDFEDLRPDEAANANRYFTETVFPVLTPLAFDPGRPFPHISNLSLNLAVVIRDRQGEQHFARVKVPDSLPQFVPADGRSGVTTKRGKPRKRVVLVWLEQLISANLQELFPGMEIIEAHPFHVTRDADIEIREAEAEDLLESIERGVLQRRFGDVVRLIVSEAMPEHVFSILLSNLEITRNEVYRVAGPVGLARLMSLYKLDRQDLKYPAFAPGLPDRLAQPPESDLFAAIRKHDVLLHHPFDSFQPVVDFLAAAARDENVLTIKMVLYRVGRNSPVVDALLQAARNGKQVAVLVELKARFDEESNIEWARRLENEGVHVVYGLPGLKVHCKVALVVRKEQDGIRRYVHLGTGNYNAVTAHLYTDLGLLTCTEALADEAGHLFNFLTGYSDKSDYQHLLVAPVNLRDRLRSLIGREIEHAQQGRGGWMILKMNSLVDPSLIRALYRASQAGVKVQLLVRGICCLRPGVPGISDNIEVISIVGRFLEHSRIYYFSNGGECDEVYLGSADLMPRNLDRRVEVIFPVLDRELAARIRDELLPLYLADTAKGRRLTTDGQYKRRTTPPAGSALDSQAALMRRREVRQ